MGLNGYIFLQNLCLETVIRKLKADDSMSEGLIEQFVNEGVPELIRLEEDILLIWALAVDGSWHLCGQCDRCEVWMQFPWVEHQCLNESFRPGLGEEVAIVTAVETSVAEVTQNLFCEESILDDDEQPTVSH